MRGPPAPPHPGEPPGAPKAWRWVFPRSYSKISIPYNCDVFMVIDANSIEDPDFDPAATSSFSLPSPLPRYALLFPHGISRAIPIRGIRSIPIVANASSQKGERAGANPRAAQLPVHHCRVRSRYAVLETPPGRRCNCSLVVLPQYLVCTKEAVVPFLFFFFNFPRLHIRLHRRYGRHALTALASPLGG